MLYTMLKRKEGSSSFKIFSSHKLPDIFLAHWLILFSPVCGQLTKTATAATAETQQSLQALQRKVLALRFNISIAIHGHKIQYNKLSLEQGCWGQGTSFSMSVYVLQLVVFMDEYDKRYAVSRHCWQWPAAPTEIVTMSKTRFVFIIPRRLHLQESCHHLSKL